jgi:peptidoglycan/LPS O-acetylase OafA/YrhL
MTRAHDNNYNVLRLIFAVAVIFSHSFELLHQGDPVESLTGSASLGTLGVCGFFLLSGYLTAQSWHGEPQPLAFLMKRALRLYPAFVVASLVSVFIVGPLAASTADYWGQWVPAKFLSDVIALRQPRTPPVFASSPVPSVNGAMWTITFELRCYLLLTALGLVGAFSRRASMLAFTTLLAVAVIATGPANPGDEGRALLGISGYMLWFASIYMTGVLAFLYRDRIAYRRSLAIVAVVVLMFGLFGPNEAFRPAVLTGGAYALFYVGQSRSTLLARLRTREDLSYGLYLYGWPVTQLASLWFPSIKPIPMFLVVLLVSATLAFASWRLVEKPALRFKRRRPAMLEPVESLIR